MARDRVFVSFDWDNDRRYKHLLEAWDANTDFDFKFGDNTPTEIKSNDIGRIKAALTTKIRDSTHTLVIVGKYANSKHEDSDEIGFRNWINFEVHQSIGNTKIRVIKLEKDLKLPEELDGQQYTWITGFTTPNVTEVLKA